MKGDFLMSQPVTTNPFIIMMINMTVVFIVLVSLSVLINVIHMIDPTKEPEVKDAGGGDEEVKNETAAIVSKLQQNPAPAPVIEEGISPEVIAAISAAIACYGISGQVRAVRVVNPNRSAWRQNALTGGLTNV